MAKLESDVVRPINPPFYDRYVDGVFSKIKQDEADRLFEQLNSYHPNIQFTVDENPDHSWIQLFHMTTMNSSVMYIENQESTPLTGHHKYQNLGKETQSPEPFTERNIFLLIFTEM